MEASMRNVVFVLFSILLLSGSSFAINADFITIPGGSFYMGSPEEESGRRSDETRHFVALTNGFEMQTSEVTQEQWVSLMNHNPSKNKGDNNPVENVTWYEVQVFLGMLNFQNDGYVYRLPTEAEWEFAARGGTSTAYHFANDAALLNGYAWYGVNSSASTHPVKMKLPNQFGLFDMHGNVHEWVNDFYGEYPQDEVTTDPKGPESGKDRTIRGGGFADVDLHVRSAFRFQADPGTRYHYLGFRLVRTRQ